MKPVKDVQEPIIGFRFQLHVQLVDCEVEICHRDEDNKDNDHSHRSPAVGNRGAPVLFGLEEIFIRWAIRKVFKK